MKIGAFRNQKKSQHTRKYSRKDIARSSVLEAKKNGTLDTATNLRENVIPPPLTCCSDSKIQVTQSSRVSGAVPDWGGKLRRRPNEKEVNSDESAPNPNEKILKTVNSQEVNSLVRTSGRHPAFGNS